MTLMLFFFFSAGSLDDTYFQKTSLPALDSTTSVQLWFCLAILRTLCKPPAQNKWLKCTSIYLDCCWCQVCVRVFDIMMSIFAIIFYDFHIFCLLLYRVPPLWTVVGVKCMCECLTLSCWFLCVVFYNLSFFCRLLYYLHLRASSYSLCEANRLKICI